MRFNIAVPPVERTHRKVRYNITLGGVKCKKEVDAGSTTSTLRKKQ
jgi:hypothetical protein